MRAAKEYVLRIHYKKSTYQVSSRAVRPHGESLPGSRLSVCQDGRTGAAYEALHGGLGGHGVDAGLGCILVEHRVKTVGLAIIRQVQLQLKYTVWVPLGDTTSVEELI